MILQIELPVNWERHRSISNRESVKGKSGLADPSNELLGVLRRINSEESVGRRFGLGSWHPE